MIWACLPSMVLGQTVLESLLHAYQTATTLNDKQKTAIELGDYYTKKLAYQKANEYFVQALAIKEPKMGKKNELTLLRKTADNYSQLKNYDQAIQYYQQLLTLNPQNELYNEVLSQLSWCNKNKGEYDDALKYNQQLLNRYKQSKDSSGIAGTANNIGMLQQYLGNYTQALSVLNDALSYSPDKVQFYQIKLNLGVVHLKAGKYKEAESIFEDVYANAENEAINLESLNYKSFSQYLQNKPESALTSGLLANDIAKSTGNKQALLNNVKLLSDIYEELGSFKISKDYANEYQRLKAELAKEEAKVIDEFITKQLEIEQQEARIKDLLSKQEQVAAKEREERLEFDKRNKELQLREQELTLLKRDQALRQAELKRQALEKEQIAQRLKLAEQKALTIQREQELQLEQEEATRQKLLAEKSNLERLKKQQELESAQKEQALQSKQLVQEKSLRKYGYGVIALIGVILLMAVAGLVNTRKAKRIVDQKKAEIISQYEELKITKEALEAQREHVQYQNTQLEERNKEIYQKNEEMLAQNEELRQAQEELETQRDYVSAQNEILEDKNITINSSIAYALNIQTAILPNLAILNEKFFGHFLIYYPKDVVSGDFYWMEQRDNLTFLSVIDCTGHGVPGAFMSMIGYSLLNEIVNSKKLTDPAEILEELHLRVHKSLRQAKTNNQDGMDLSLLVIDHSNSEGDRINVHYAGARISLYYYDPLEQGLQEIRGTKRSIGGTYPKKRPFATHQVKLAKGSTVYMTTDGFADQNNKDRDKISKRGLRALLKRVVTLELNEQAVEIEKAFLAHKGQEEQRDDVTLLGFKI